MSMEGKMIEEFLLELGNDSDLFDAYVKDPYSVLETSGLTQEQQGVLLSNDFGTIRARVLQESGDPDGVVICKMVGVWPSPPPPPPPGT